MTTTITVSVPPKADFRVIVVTEHVPRGPNDDGRRYTPVNPGDTLTFYIYGGISVSSIREVPL